MVGMDGQTPVPSCLALNVGVIAGIIKNFPLISCTGCGKCLSKCPQHIRIPEQMQRIDRYVEALKQNKL